jgi:mono/diheme cytochrome c family protein
MAFGLRSPKTNLQIGTHHSAQWLAAALLLVAASLALGAGEVLAIFGVGESKEEEPVPLVPVPDEYKGKKMPSGWWTDPKMVEAGQAIYEGKINSEVVCAECHGSDGQPTRKGRGARDLRNAKNINRFTEEYWFWRISEGVPKTKMQGWKNVLTEEQRWQVMAYEHTFSHGGKAEPHEHPELKQ